MLINELGELLVLQKKNDAKIREGDEACASSRACCRLMPE
jgi:hypothetical protein